MNSERAKVIGARMLLLCGMIAAFGLLASSGSPSLMAAGFGAYRADVKPADVGLPHIAIPGIKLEPGRL